MAHALWRFGPSLPRHGSRMSGPMRRTPASSRGGRRNRWAGRSRSSRGRTRYGASWSRRTFGWWGGSRRLAKAYDYQLESSEAMSYAAIRYVPPANATARSSSLQSLWRTGQPDAEGWAGALLGVQLKLAPPVPHPTPWIQMVWMPGVFGARSVSETAMFAVNDSSLPSPCR